MVTYYVCKFVYWLSIKLYPTLKPVMTRAEESQYKDDMMILKGSMEEYERRGKNG